LTPVNKFVNLFNGVENTQELSVLPLTVFRVFQEVRRELLLVHYLRKSICHKVSMLSLVVGDHLVLKELEEVEVFVKFSVLDHALLVDVEQHLLLMVQREVGELAEADHLNQCRDVQLLIVLEVSISHDPELAVPPATALEDLVHERDKVEIVGVQEVDRRLEHVSEWRRCLHKRLDGFQRDFRAHALVFHAASKLFLDDLLH